VETEWSPPVYTVRRIEQPVQVDGKLDEPAWFAAPSLSLNHFTWHKAGKQELSVAKLLWDDEYLYIACVCQDAHITAQHTERDGPIPQDDCFEIMVAPNSEKPEVYFNIEWNVIGGIVDNFRPNGPKQPKAPKWDAEGIKISGAFSGTLNDDTDMDALWIVEVAIPFRNFAEVMGKPFPKIGDHWNANFNRHGGKTNLQYSQWSRANTPAPSFHTPDRFGRIVFSDEVSPFGNGQAKLP
jgi:hypothetical protein